MTISLTGVSKGQNGTKVNFPANASTSNAIRLMAAGKVSSKRNRCAGTMRGAMGFGLGDAHKWTRLPGYGYSARAKGESAQPGDIVVWPFTFGSRNSQHIGIAVGTENGTRLLSNLSGDLCLSALAPRYRAYYKTTATDEGPQMLARRQRMPEVFPQPEEGKVVRSPEGKVAGTAG